MQLKQWIDGQVISKHDLKALIDQLDQQTQDAGASNNSSRGHHEYPDRGPGWLSKIKAWFQQKQEHLTQEQHDSAPGQALQQKLLQQKLLQQLCTRHGLSVTGDDQVLRDRLKSVRTRIISAHLI